MTAVTIEARAAERRQRYPGRAAVISWIFFDWAAQPYFTLITTFVFAPYVRAGRAGPGKRQALGISTAAAGLVIAYLAVLGAIADANGRRKRRSPVWCAVRERREPDWIGRPGDSSMIPPLLLVYAIASVGVEFARLQRCDDADPGAAPQDRPILAPAGATGYVGGILSLILVLGFLAANPDTGRTLFGLTPCSGSIP